MTLQQLAKFSKSFAIMFRGSACISFISLESEMSMITIEQRSEAAMRSLGLLVLRFCY